MLETSLGWRISLYVCSILHVLCASCVVAAPIAREGRVESHDRLYFRHVAAGVSIRAAGCCFNPVRSTPCLALSVQSVNM